MTSVAQRQEIFKMIENISQLQDETQDLKGQRVSLEAAIADADLRG